ncbi:MAG: ABC transporter ATP-binding protein [Eggerthellaceae bacterium]
MSLIEFDKVSKAFFTDGKRKQASLALREMSLSIEEGEFVSIVGPSGCGKTVSLSMMAGFLFPTLGEVRFKGRPITAPGPERGVVFQQFSLMPWLTVEQNVAFAVKNAQRKLSKRTDKSQIAQRVRYSLKTVGLSHVAESYPNTLSGGMQQRVAIARLLAMDSDVFLMDEPFSALDEQTRQHLDKSLFDLWKTSGKTIVFVTHNISEAVLMSSRILLLSSSPSCVCGEWTIPADTERDLESSRLRSLVQEIRTQLAFNSRTIATGIEG